MQELEQYLERISNDDVTLTDINLNGYKLLDSDIIRLVACLHEHPTVANRLKKLVLANNCLTALHLVGFDSLEQLYVDANQLQSVNLVGLKSLHTLLLRNNNLTAINLVDLPSLAMLDISRNQLSMLDLRHLYNLSEIHAGENKITGVELHGLQRLHFLVLCENRLTKIELSGLENLQDLRLDHNKLKSINLCELKKLERLSLDDNELHNIDLTDSESLCVLNICNNPLTFPPIPRCKKTIEKLKSIHLDLNKNNLTEFGKIVVAAMSHEDYIFSGSQHAIHHVVYDQDQDQDQDRLDIDQLTSAAIEDAVQEHFATRRQIGLRKGMLFAAALGYKLPTDIKHSIINKYLSDNEQRAEYVFLTEMFKYLPDSYANKQVILASMETAFENNLGLRRFLSGPGLHEVIGLVYQPRKTVSNKDEGSAATQELTQGSSLDDNVQSSLSEEGAHSSLAKLR